MTTMTLQTVDLQKFAAEVRAMANAVFETPGYKRVLNMKLNRKRAQVYTLQKAHWNINRRDCWGFAQGHAPMDVKKMIWEHEEDELAGNKTRGVEDHFALQVRSSAEIGLTPDDFRNEPVRPGTRMAIYSYLHLVNSGHWLKSVSACAALEVSNSAEWVKLGGMSYRMGKRFESELGIPFEKQLNAKEHAEVDVEHAHMLMQIAKRHGGAPGALNWMLEGLRESWELDGIWKGILADMMEEIPL